MTKSFQFALNKIAEAFQKRAEDFYLIKLKIKFKALLTDSFLN